MSGATMTPSSQIPDRGPVPDRGPLAWAGAGCRSACRGLSFCLIGLAGGALLLALVAPMIVAGLGAGRLLIRHMHVNMLASPGPNGGVHIQQVSTGGSMVVGVILAAAVIAAGIAVSLYLLPRILLAVRWLATLTRQMVSERCGVPIADPYLPASQDPRALSWRRRTGWLLADPATGRDLLWLALNASVGWMLAILPAGLAAVGLLGFILPSLQPVPGSLGPLGSVFPAPSHRLVLLAVGTGLIALGLWEAPRLLRGYGLLARWLLAPTGQAALAARVQYLAQTRDDVLDSGAAEIRRIERDLHDGAQARLVAVGMTLDAAGQILEDNPAAARALLLEARDSSAKALAELRDLVRGIHPPVLADRGLADAVRALTLDSPLRAQLASDLPGRLPAPVESAAYFAVCELLANAAKHAAARQAWIDLRHAEGLLRASVTDDGAGGADPARGTGLRGIEHRLAAFDGVLAVSSPPGGPTVVTMEIPCALSSPKTSSC